MRKLIAGLTLVAVTVLTGCVQAPAAPETPTVESTGESRASVDWDAYPPATQSTIDDAQAEGDCDGLQGMFDVADNAGFTDQMKYIDEAMSLADCY